MKAVWHVTKTKKENKQLDHPNVQLQPKEHISRPQITGLYRSVEEQPVPVEGQIKGAIPSWLSGRLIRNGPGLFEIGDTKMNHFFDGMALLHSFTIQSGKVTYTSKFLRSDTYKQSMAAKRLVVSQFGTAAIPDPCKTMFQKFSTYFSSLIDTFGGMISDNCMVNVYPVGDNFVAATDGDFVHVFSPETLDSEEKVQISKRIGILVATAHPHIDNDGTLYNLGSTVRGYAIIKIPPAEKGADIMKNASVVCTIPATNIMRPGYSHSFAMTEDYFVFLEQPLRINIPKIFKSKVQHNPLCPTKMVEWDENEMVRFFVVERSTGKILPQKFYAPPMLVLHHINAYEDNGHIVMDVCAFKEWSIYKAFDLENLIIDGSSSVDVDTPDKSMDVEVDTRRYVLPINRDIKDPTKGNLVTLDYTSATAKFEKGRSIMCHHEVISEKAFEMPQINYEKYNGKPYQFTYGVGGKLPELNELIKTDVRTKKCTTWTEEGCGVSEPVFVGSPDATEEDDGVLLSAVLRVDDKSGPPFLLVLDAKTMTEMGRVEFPGIRWHMDIHGRFMKS